jgi:hypothetical protein
MQKNSNKEKGGTRNHGFGQQRGRCSPDAGGAAQGRSLGGRRHPKRKLSLRFG